MEKFKSPFLWFQGSKTNSKYVSAQESLILIGNVGGFLSGPEKEDFIIDSNQNLYRIFGQNLLEKNPRPWWVKRPFISKLIMNLSLWNPVVKIELVLSPTLEKLPLAEIKKRVLSHQRHWMNSTDKETANEFKDKLSKSLTIRQVIDAVDPDPKATQEKIIKINENGPGLSKTFFDLSGQFKKYGWQKWPASLFLIVSILLGVFIKDPTTPSDFFFLLSSPVLATFFGFWLFFGGEK